QGTAVAGSGGVTAWMASRLFGGRVRGNFLLAAGLAIVMLMLVATLLAGWLAPYSPVQDCGARLAVPTAAHWLGTDQLSRDVLSRILHGGRVPITVALLSCLISLVVGSVLGLVSGFRGGMLDRILSLIMDAIFSFPALILAIAIVAVLGAGLANMVLAISFVYIPTYFRVVRGQVLQIRELEHVEAARALGAGTLRLLFRHVAPAALPSVLALTSFNIADGILTEAALAFLGFGLPPPTPDWGFDIQNGQKFLQAGYWWLVTFPGLAIVFLALGFGMLGEGLNDMLSPTRQQRLAG
ncbi:MAG: ABC transporter permease, partial [Firmicutes bacterium]|nr:ABC transporter permease [Bacillota bacterium]